MKWNSEWRLQKLQSIRIVCPRDIDEGIDDTDEQIDDILSFITDSVLIDFVNNCSEINWIALRCKPNISYGTIDALIALPLRKPHIQFKHYFFSYFGWAKDIVYNSIDLKNLQLPNNLVINKL
jgi:hypothetical protein